MVWHEGAAETGRRDKKGREENQSVTVIWLQGKIHKLQIATACDSELCASLSFQHLLPWLPSSGSPALI